MTGLPNGISCTNGQHTRGKSAHKLPLKEKDRRRQQAWVRFVQRHRPRWSSTNSSFLCSDHYDDGCFTKNREIDATDPATDLSLADTADTIDQSLTDRAKRQMRFIYVFVF